MEGTSCVKSGVFKVLESYRILCGCLLLVNHHLLCLGDGVWLALGGNPCFFQELVNIVNIYCLEEYPGFSCACELFPSFESVLSG